MTTSPDTIFALSSGRPPVAIAVIRISGPQAGAALEALTGRIPAPRKGSLARVRDPQSGELIDEALALWFPGPRSETGEDTAELQVHGGHAIIAATLRALGQVPGLRPAEAGEFTRRAFLNGQLDLTAVEGLADLIAAETEGQRRQALRHYSGVLREKAEGWRTQLIQALALVEARIDFSDESDVPDGLDVPAREIARALRDEIAAVLAEGRRGERLRDGFVVAIAGPPNAGKSTLLNRIAKRDVAIVSPYAGTTRDVIEVHLDLDGWPVTLLDTAGIRETDDPVEQEGVRRARDRAAQADLVLWVTDAAGGATPPPEMEAPVWQVVNKSDLVAGGGSSGVEMTGAVEAKVPEFRLSALLDAGVGDLIAAIGVRAGAAMAGESALIARERHRRALAATRDHLGAADGELREEILAEHLRLASRELGRLTGRVDVEDILDVIFRDFCIGK